MAVPLPLFLGVVIAYWAILLIIGYIGYKKTLPTATSYFLADRRFGSFVLALAMLASIQSAWLMLGHQGLQYSVGLAYTTYFAHLYIMLLLGLLPFYKYLWLLSHKYGYITVGEMAEDYFNSRLIRILIGILAIFYGIGYIAIQLVGAGLVFEVFTAGLIPAWVGALVMSVVVAMYVFSGGWRSTAWTDALQGILLVLGIFALMGTVLWYIGGWGPLWDRALSELPAKYFKVELGLVTWGLVFMIGLAIAPIGIYTSPQYSMQIFSAKSFKAVRLFVIIILSIASFYYFFNTVIIGMGGRLLFPDLKTPDTLPIVIANELMPPVLAMLYVIGLLAAMNSTADIYLLYTSGIVMRDIVLPLSGHKSHGQSGIPEAKQILYSRIIIILLLLATIGMVFYKALYTAIALFGPIATAFGMQMIPALLAMTRVARFTKAGIASGMIVGMIAAILTGLIWPNPFTIHSSIWSTLLNLLVCTVVSRFTSPVPTERIQKFHGYLAEEEGSRLPRRLLPRTRLGWIIFTLAIIYMLLHMGPIVTLFYGYTLWLWNIAMWIFAAIIILIAIYKLKML
jgi:SSS family solute:Na+ symporter